MRTLLFSLATTLLCATPMASAQTYGHDVAGYQETFGFYESRNRVRQFPFLSQIEQGKTFSDPSKSYDYTADGSRNAPKSGLTQACGPIALLLISNQKYQNNANKNNDVLRQDVAALRAQASISGDQVTNVYQLKQMVGHSLVDLFYAQHDEELNHEASYNGGQEFDGGASDLHAVWSAISAELSNRRRVIMLLKPGSVVPPGLDYNHFVVVYQVKNFSSTGKYGNAGYVYYIDPWTGQKQARSKDDFLDSLYLGDTQDYLVVN